MPLHGWDKSTGQQILIPKAAEENGFRLLKFGRWAPVPLNHNSSHVRKRATLEFPLPSLFLQGAFIPPCPLQRRLHESPSLEALLYSVSLLLVVPSFLMISCFLDFTMAELLSVSLLKKAGGWVLFPGDLEPIL